MSRAAATRIVGIDPGLRATGYAVIDSDGDRHACVADGTLAPRAGMELPARLGALFEAATRLFETHRPDSMSIESVFVARDPSAAIKLGHARGAVICAAVRCGLPVGEYSPNHIKRAVVGRGKAGKEQVAYMVTRLLGLPERQPGDATDAMAVALCHAFTVAGGAR